MRSLVGKVTSNKMQKSVVVAVDRFRMHSKYPKMVRTTKKIMAHDEHDQCNIGDKVKIESCRPLSKHKSWTVTSILQRSRMVALTDPLNTTGAAAGATGAPGAASAPPSASASAEDAQKMDTQ